MLQMWMEMDRELVRAVAVVDLDWKWKESAQCPGV